MEQIKICFAFVIIKIIPTEVYTMKKIFAFTLVIVMALSLCACGRRTTTTTPEYKTLSGDVVTPDEVVSSQDYADTLEGLCKYLEDKNCIYELPQASGDEKITDPVVMSAGTIGADKGYKFTYKYEGKEIVTELYSYTDTDNKWYQQAVAEGKITLSDEIENGTFEVVVNGKYVMVYNDSADRAERKTQVIDAFKSFDVK